MLTAMVGLVTVAHLFVVDCRNQHLQNTMFQVSEYMYTVNQQWTESENYPHV